MADLKQLQVVPLDFLVPVQLDQALSVAPGTVVYTACWTPCGDEVEVGGYFAGGHSYHHAGMGDWYAWIQFKREHPILAASPLGHSDEEAQALLVVHCGSRRCWLVHREYLERDLQHRLVDTVEQWLSAFPA